ncbi:TPA: hypothetical protein ACH3X1_003106 [Trebouxia sp. C0004]
MSQPTAAARAKQPGSHSSEPPQQPAWDPPRAAHISEDIGLLGFFADTGQQTRPPREELEKLLPGRDGSVLIRASLSDQITSDQRAYDALRKEFMQAEVSGGVTKRRLVGLLDQWYVWGRLQPQLCQHAHRLCYGPKLTAEIFDIATIQEVPVSTTKTEGNKRSRESVVLMKDNNKCWAGRIRFFLSHTPPGVDVSDESGVFIAHVNWYNHLPQGQNMSAMLNCPIFKTSFKDDKGGNMWPVEKLAPCKLGAVY